MAFRNAKTSVRTAFALFAVSAASLFAAPQDVLDRVRVSPQLLMQQRAELGLSADQIQSIQKIAQETGAKAQTLNREFQQARQKLAQLMQQDDIDEKNVMQAADAAFAVDKQQQQLQIKMNIALRKLLTDKQSKWILSFLRDQNRQADQQTVRLVQRVQAIQKTAEGMQKQGQNVRQIGQLLQKIGPLMRDRRLDEVEQHVARAEQFLRAAADAKQEKTLKVRQPSGRPGTKVEELPFAKLESEVRGLKQQEVAWRKINWRTCLIDGLRESREKKKPLILWVFIDRPIDDERC